jgi:D-ribose pyranase
MKKGGVIHAELSRELAALGHGDSFMICDAGFPIPIGVAQIDLALAFHVPNLRQCLEAVLSEVVVQKVVIAEEMAGLNPGGAAYLAGLFKRQAFERVPQAALCQMARGVKFILRSGELAPYSNVLLEAASGVYDFKKDLIIDPRGAGI